MLMCQFILFTQWTEFIHKWKLSVFFAKPVCEGNNKMERGYEYVN
jgi:hypothetical protein